MAKDDSGNISTPYNDGAVRGDAGAIPDKGTGTGLNGDTYGASIAPDATNGQGSIGGATKSDAPTARQSPAALK